MERSTCVEGETARIQCARKQTDRLRDLKRTKCAPMKGELVNHLSVDESKGDTTMFSCKLLNYQAVKRDDIALINLDSLMRVQAPTIRMVMRLRARTLLVFHRAHKHR